MLVGVDVVESGARCVEQFVECLVVVLVYVVGIR